MGKWGVIREEIKGRGLKCLMGSLHLEYASSVQGKANELYVMGYRCKDIAIMLKFPTKQIDKFIRIESKCSLLLRLEITFWCIESEIEDSKLCDILNIDRGTLRRYKTIIEKELEEQSERYAIVRAFYMAGYNLDVISDILCDETIVKIDKRTEKHRQHLVNTLKCDVINGNSVESICKLRGLDRGSVERLLVR